MTDPDLPRPPAAPTLAPPVAGRWSVRLARLALALVVAAVAQFAGSAIDGLRAADAVGFSPALSDRLRQATLGANTATALLVLVAVLLVLLPELISGVVVPRSGIVGVVLKMTAVVGAAFVVASAVGLYLQLVAPGSFKALDMLNRLANLVLAGAAGWTAFTALADGRLAPRLGHFAPKSSA